MRILKIGSEEKKLVHEKTKKQDTWISLDWSKNTKNYYEDVLFYFYETNWTQETFPIRHLYSMVTIKGCRLAYTWNKGT